ncbi:MAG: FIST C-terminal domain-containing protein, partial [Thermodesulfobacteriota bacterium]|nr:FIST C-terminal domain-containing protein [Thermodesulfobacteriota bacterium]
GSITTVSSVAKMDSLYIMIGKKEDLIESAGKLGREVSTSSTSSTLFLFDCISRVFFLGDDFTRELKAIHQATENSRIVGLASVGEISNAGFDKTKVFNKTTLLGAVQDG